MMRVLSVNRPMFSVNFYISFIYQTYFKTFSEISLTVIFQNRIKERRGL